MKYSDIKAIISAHIDAGDARTVFSIEGSPGCGKSALGDEIAAIHKFDSVVNLNLSLLDVPDVAGLALLGSDSGVLEFRHTAAMKSLTTGRNLLILDELADANMTLQNLGRRLLWTREVNGLALSPQTFILTMSNRTADKSGAGRMSGKVKSAVSRLTMESNLEDWVPWAVGAGLPLPLVMFLRFKPSVFDKYDPDADVSPTPRQWEMVGRIPQSLWASPGLYFADVASKVGDGAAAEYTAFLRLSQSLPSPAQIQADPLGHPIPQDLSAVYALTGSLAHAANRATVARIAPYIDRLPPAFSVLFWSDATTRCPEVQNTPEFVKWAAANDNALAPGARAAGGKSS